MLRHLLKPASLLTLALGLAALPSLPARADRAITPEEFEAHVTGKTLTYAQFGEVFGIEEYLPGRKVRWQFSQDICQYGSWYPKEGGLICFVYEYDPDEHCWSFWKEGDILRALSVNDAPGSELTEVRQSDQGLACPGPDVGV